MRSQTNKQYKRVVVLDTSAFLAGYDPFLFGEQNVTVPKVEQEIRKNSMVRLRFEIAIENGKLKVKLPNEEFSKKARLSACGVGDSFKLSETDVELLALALELKSEGYLPQVVTDDYSIQNVAKEMDIEFVALATFGIKRLLKWMRYCPACYREYVSDYKAKECKICGTELKRKSRKVRLG